jgi:alpha-mannosidase
MIPRRPLIESRRRLVWISSILLAFASLTPAFAGRSEASKDTSAPGFDLTRDKVLYTVGYAHLDTQWRWTYQDTIGNFIPNTLRLNFRLFENYPDYRFNFTGARRYAMMKEYYPKDFETVKSWIARGRWHVCGSSVDECDVNVPSPESILRHVLYGNRYFEREFGKTSVDFMLPDCFGFPASLPSILAHCGLKGFSTQKLTWGSAAGIPFNLGKWTGPDGQSVVAALNPGDYIGTIRADLSKDPGWERRIQDHGQSFGAYADYHYYGVGDVGGAPDDESVEWLEKSIHGDGTIQVAAAAGDQMFRDLTPEQIDRMPEYRGDLLLTEHSAGSLTSQAYMKRWNRKNELLADAAERACAAADWLGALDYPRESLNEAWWLVLGSQMHDILPGTSLPKAYEFSWNDEVLALNRFASVLESAVGGVVRGLDTRVEGTALVVFNSLSIARQDAVEARIPFPEGCPEAVRVFDSMRQEVPCQIARRAPGALEIIFLAKTPPVSFTVYDVRASSIPCPLASELKVTRDSLENARYRVTLNVEGDVASVWDKAANRELLSAPIRLALFTDAPEQWPAWNMDWKDHQSPPRTLVGGPAQVEIVEQGPARIALGIVREAEGSRFAQIVRLAAGEAGNRLEFDTEIDWRTRGACLKAVFPLSASNTMASYNLGLGVIQRGNNDPKKYEVPSRQWFDLTDASGNFGVTIMEDCKYGSDKPDDSTLRLTLLRTPECTSYFDQATQDLGRHEMLYALAGHTGEWNQSNVSWQVARLNQPLSAFLAPQDSGALGKIFSFLDVSNEQAAITAIKQAEDGSSLVVRVQEIHGKPAKDVHVGFAAAIRKAEEVDGQERPMRDVKLENGGLTFDLRPFQIRSFRIRLNRYPQSLSIPHFSCLRLAFDTDVASLDGEAGLGGFDGEGRSLPAELLPERIDSGGIPFELGKTRTGDKNALACKGQAIALSRGRYNRLYLLAASVQDTSAIFKIDGQPVELGIQSWTGYIGQWDNRIWKNENEIEGLVPGYIKRDPVAWFASHRHNEKGANDIYQYCYLFKYGIDLPKGAREIVLPENESIRILAMTIAQDEAGDTRPAQLLYDDLQRGVGAPESDIEEGRESI